MGDAIDISFFRDLLEKKRDELLVRRDQHLDAAGTVELDQARVGRLSRMDALQGQAMAQATSERRRLEIARIDAAVKRMDEGEFGYCVECGNEIAEKRLELSPAIARCVDCAA